MKEEKKNKYIKKTFEIEEDLMHEFNIYAACERKKQREMINIILRTYLRQYAR